MSQSQNKGPRAVSTCTEDTLSIIFKSFYLLLCVCMMMWAKKHMDHTCVEVRGRLSIHSCVDSCHPTSVAKLTQ